MRAVEKGVLFLWNSFSWLLWLLIWIELGICVGLEILWIGAREDWIASTFLVLFQTGVKCKPHCTQFGKRMMFLIHPKIANYFEVHFENPTRANNSPGAVSAGGLREAATAASRSFSPLAESPPLLPFFSLSASSSSPWRLRFSCCRRSEIDSVDGECRQYSTICFLGHNCPNRNKFLAKYTYTVPISYDPNQKDFEDKTFTHLSFG